MEQDTTCPYCNERPMVKRKNAATCGDKACQRKRELERLNTDEWRERMRNNMRATFLNISGSLSGQYGSRKSFTTISLSLLSRSARRICLCCVALLGRVAL